MAHLYVVQFIQLYMQILVLCITPNKLTFNHLRHENGAVTWNKLEYVSINQVETIAVCLGIISSLLCQVSCTYHLPSDLNGQVNAEDLC